MIGSKIRIGTVMRKKFISLCLGLAMVLGLGLIVAQPASAAVGNISVTVTNQQCPRGGNVSGRVNVTITTPGTAGSNWYGNTVWGLSAFSGQNNLVQGSNFCKTTWYGGGYYWYWSVYRWISFDGQHTYV
jgi:hypothetical protein